MAINFCKYCGTKRLKDAKFCTGCGKPFTIIPETNLIVETDSNEEVENRLEKIDNTFKDNPIIETDPNEEVENLLEEIDDFIKGNPIVETDSNEEVENHLEKIDNFVKDISETESYSKITRAEKKSKLIKYFYIYEKYSIDDLTNKFKVSEKTIKKILEKEGISC